MIMQDSPPMDRYSRHPCFLYDVHQIEGVDSGWEEPDFTCDRYSNLTN